MGSDPRQRARAVEDLARQWSGAAQPGDAERWLTRQIVDALGGLGILGIDEQETAEIVQAWEEAQVASDVSPLGRSARPLVLLLPSNWSWTAGSATDGWLAGEPGAHTSAVAALRALAARRGLETAGKVASPTLPPRGRLLVATEG